MQSKYSEIHEVVDFFRHMLFRQPQHRGLPGFWQWREHIVVMFP